MDTNLLSIKRDIYKHCRAHKYIYMYKSTSQCMVHLVDLSVHTVREAAHAHNSAVALDQESGL